MNKKEFDRRMESAIGLLDAPRSLAMFILIILLYGMLSFYYYGASTYEPGLKTTLIETYCMHEAPMSCFYFSGSIIPWADSLKITHYWLPWSLFVRQILLLPAVIFTYLLTWILKYLRWWKLYWFFIFLFRLSFVNVIAVLGEGIFDFGVIDFLWREVFAWCNLVLMLFVLTLSLWNRELLERLTALKKIGPLVSGLGGGGAALGVFLARLFGRSKSGISFLVIIGMIGNFLLVLVTGMKFSQLLWNASPWRLEAEIHAKENGEDSAKWAKIKKLIF